VIKIFKASASFGIQSTFLKRPVGFKELRFLPPDLFWSRPGFFHMRKALSCGRYDKSNLFQN
jgi:hypothetical protein